MKEWGLSAYFSLCIPTQISSVASIGIEFPETPLAKAQGVLANVPALLLFLDGNVALDGRSQGF